MDTLRNRIDRKMHLTWTYDLGIELSISVTREDDYLRESVKGCFRISPDDFEYPRKGFGLDKDESRQSGREKGRNSERRITGEALEHTNT